MNAWQNILNNAQAPGSWGQGGGHLGSSVGANGLQNGMPAQYRSGTGWGATGGVGSNQAPPAWAPMGSSFQPANLNQLIMSVFRAQTKPTVPFTYTPPVYQPPVGAGSGVTPSYVFGGGGSIGGRPTPRWNPPIYGGSSGSIVATPGATTGGGSTGFTPGLY